MVTLTRRHLLTGLGTAALLAAVPARGAAAQPHHFWPGGRIGIGRPLPAVMLPAAGDPYTLQADDPAWTVTVSEQPAIDASFDAAIWDRTRYRDRDQLLETRKGPGALEMRLFARLADTPEGQRDLGSRTLVLREGDWFGQINLLAPGLVDGAVAADHWSLFKRLSTALFDALAVRGPVSLPAFLSETGLEMDLARLNASHFGGLLVMGLKPPATPYEAYFGGPNHIVMKGMPTAIPFASRAPSASERQARISLLAQGATFWREQDGMTWFRERDAESGTSARAFRLIGFGRTRWLTFDAEAQADQVAEITAALEQVALSTQLVDLDFSHWGQGEPGQR